MMKSIVVLAAVVVSTLAKVDKAPFYKWFAGINENEVVYAVNCGSDEAHVDKNGV